MSETHPTPNASLSALLAHRARHASDARLALDLGVGLVAAAVALLWRPPGWWLLLSAALCFAAFGAWGIADRELRERFAQPGPMLLGLRIVRVLAATMGVAGAVALLFGATALALGRWIS